MTLLDRMVGSVASIDYLYDRGIREGSRGRLAAARFWLQRALRYPFFVPARRVLDMIERSEIEEKTEVAIAILRGTKLQNEGRWGQAIVVLEQAIKLDPAYDEAYLALGVCYFDHSMTTDAVGVLEQAVHIAPQRAPARATLGVVYYHAGLYTKAGTQLLAALKIDGSDARTWFYAASAYLRAFHEQEEADTAIKFFERALSLCGNNRLLRSQIHNGLGLAYRKRDSPRQANEHFERASEFDSQNAVAMRYTWPRALNERAGDASSDCSEPPRLSREPESMANSADRYCNGCGRALRLIREATAPGLLSLDRQEMSSGVGPAEYCKACGRVWCANCYPRRTANTCPCARLRDAIEVVGGVTYTGPVRLIAVQYYGELGTSHHDSKVGA